MPRIVYCSDTPAARRGWDAFDRAVLWALEVLDRPATFDEIAGLLPEGVHYPLILGSLRTVGDYNGGWQLRSAQVVDLPGRTLTDTVREAA